MKYKDLEHDAFKDCPKGNRAVIAYSHYYHKWMVVNEEEKRNVGYEMVGIRAVPKYV